LGQSQPSSQLSQQSQLQLQSGQPSQQSSQQQPPPSVQPPMVGAGVPPTNMADAIAREPNNFVNMMELTFYYLHPAGTAGLC